MLSGKKKSIIVVGLVVFVVFVLMAAVVSMNTFQKMSDNDATEENEGGNKIVQYTSITMEEAKEIFKEEENYIILDVRRADEFADGHIPGAVNVANEDIADEKPSELPDENQTIYVYCRSGNRSRQAAQKLVDMGYQNIVEIGGIMDWTGDIER